LPEITKLAKIKYQFVLHIHNLFQQGKFTKIQQKHFINLVLTILHDVTEFVPEAQELGREYLNKQVKLMSKREKEEFDGMMKNEGFEFDDINQFDVKDIWEQKRSKVEENFFQQHEEFFQQQKDDHLKNKKAALEHQDISVLYKELVKQLHPDLEQDETIRLQKEHLMKELVQARQHKDLHAMLLIKVKAQQFQKEKSADAGNQTYSLEQLKRYNKELKKKLDEHKSNFTSSLFSSLSFCFESFLEEFGKHHNPQEEIRMQLNDIKKHIKAFENDLKELQKPDDLKILIDAHKKLIRESY
jgi:hypothetical protein